MAQLFGHHPVQWKVTDSILGQDTCPSPSPVGGVQRYEPMYLTHPVSVSPSLCSPINLNRINIFFKKFLKKNKLRVLLTLTHNHKTTSALASIWVTGKFTSHVTVSELYMCAKAHQIVTSEKCSLLHISSHFLEGTAWCPGCKYWQAVKSIAMGTRVGVVLYDRFRAYKPYICTPAYCWEMIQWINRNEIAHISITWAWLSTLEWGRERVR